MVERVLCGSNKLVTRSYESVMYKHTCGGSNIKD